MIVLGEVICLVSDEVILYVKLHQNDAKILTVPAGEALGSGFSIIAALEPHWCGTQRTSQNYTVCYLCYLCIKTKQHILVMIVYVLLLSLPPSHGGSRTGCSASVALGVHAGCGGTSRAAGRPQLQVEELP